MVKDNIILSLNKPVYQFQSAKAICFFYCNSLKDETPFRKLIRENLKVKGAF